jgi:phosphatidylserine decarboxylase
MLAPGLVWSRLLFRVAQLRLPSPVLRTIIDGYARVLNIRMDEVAEPVSGFQSFGDFFARPLQEGVRPVDQSTTGLVSPCDGAVQAVGALGLDGVDSCFVVKGRRFSTAELLGRYGWWYEARAGGYVVIYLSPADYHRVHSPCLGAVRDLWRLEGTHFPVNRLGQLLAPWALVRNERVVFELEAPAGPAAVVMVGALGVSAISVSVPELSNGHGRQDAVAVTKGQELGRFNLGSTVVLLWQGSARPLVQPGERVLMGQPLVSEQ